MACNLSKMALPSSYIMWHSIRNDVVSALIVPWRNSRSDDTWFPGNSRLASPKFKKYLQTLNNTLNLEKYIYIYIYIRAFSRPRNCRKAY